MKDRIWLRVQSEWDKWKDTAKTREEAGNFHTANKVYFRLLDLCKGYTDPRGKELLAHWEDRMAANTKAVEDDTSLQFQSKE